MVINFATTQVLRKVFRRGIPGPNTIAGLPLSPALLFTLLFAAAFWFYAVLWDQAPVIAPDSGGYIQVARDLLDLRVNFLHGRPVGYPLLLLLSGSAEKPTRALFFISLAQHFASIWLVGMVLYKLGISARGLILFALLLLLPPYTEYAAYALTESLTEFLLVVGFSTLAFWAFRGRGALLLLISGVAIGYSAITRPTYQALAFTIAGLLFIAPSFTERLFSRRTALSASLCLVGVSVLFIATLSSFNYAHFGFFGIYPHTGFNLSTRTVKVIERLPDEHAGAREALIKARDAELIKRDGDHTAYLSYWGAIPELVQVTGITGPQLSNYMLKLNLTLIKEAPLRYLTEVLTSFAGYWLPSSTSLANLDSRAVQTVWGVLQLGILALFTIQFFVVTGLTVFLCSRGLFTAQYELGATLHLPPAQAFAYFLAAAIVFYNAILTAVVEVGDPRYRLPTEPLLLFMCFHGFYIWRQLSLPAKFRSALWQSSSCK
jgi:hypothetical protein